MALKNKAVSASCLYIPTHTNIIENHFNNLTSEDAETIVENTLVEVENKDIDTTIGSFWVSNNEMIVREI